MYVYVSLCMGIYVFQCVVMYSIYSHIKNSEIAKFPCKGWLVFGDFSRKLSAKLEQWPQA